MQLEDLFKKSLMLLPIQLSRQNPNSVRMVSSKLFSLEYPVFSLVFFFFLFFFFVLLRGYKTFLALSATQNKNWFMRQHAFREMKQFLIVLKVAQGLFRFCILRSVIGPQPFS